MEELLVFREGVRIGRFPLSDQPLEVGSSVACDVALDDPALSPRHYLLCPIGGTWRVFDLVGAGRGAGGGVHLGLGVPLPVGRQHSLCRRSAEAAATGVAEPDTQRCGGPGGGAGGAVPMWLRIGRGDHSRRVRLRPRPLRIGRAEDNEVRLLDPAVSQYHCRIEPLPSGGCLLRDLDSSNGTRLGGARVQRAVIDVGQVVRVGDTTLRIDAEASPAGAGDAGMVVRSDAMRATLEQARAVASVPWAVLLHGESGAGKEGVAAAIHRLGSRADGPFVTLNAGGLAPTLVESELFGHERGAFTGADGARRGVFEQSDGGTLLLDEIGELPPALQSRLLRVLETGEVRRLGGERARRVDVRVVSATHRDLPALVREGRFRQDLYYRIARLVIEVPPLRDRPADVAALIDHFMAEVVGSLGPRELTCAARSRLRSHRWPGNVRELRNVLCSAAAAAVDERIDVGDVELALHRISPAVAAPASLEAPQLRAAVARYGGNVAAAARALGVPRSTLRDRLRELSGAG